MLAARHDVLPRSTTSAVEALWKHLKAESSAQWSHACITHMQETPARQRFLRGRRNPAQMGEKGASYLIT